MPPTCYLLSVSLSHCMLAALLTYSIWLHRLLLKSLRSHGSSAEWSASPLFSPKHFSQSCTQEQTEVAGPPTAQTCDWCTNALEQRFRHAGKIFGAATSCLCCTTCSWSTKIGKGSVHPYRGRHNSSRGCCTGSEATEESYLGDVSGKYPNSVYHCTPESKTSGGDATGPLWFCDGEGDEVCCAPGSPEKVFTPFYKTFIIMREKRFIVMWINFISRYMGL